MSILEVTDLSMSYADKQLYDQASFVLNKEDHMGVIGQNGAGKSTLIRLITGQTLPDAGQIKWQRGKKIGYLDQYAESAHDLTIGAFLQSAFKKLYDTASPCSSAPNSTLPAVTNKRTINATFTST